MKNNTLSADNPSDAQANGIDALRARFINLENENKKLKQRKRQIDEECEKIR